MTNPETVLERQTARLKEAVLSGQLPKAYRNSERRGRKKPLRNPVGVFLLDWSMELPWDEEDRMKVISLMDIDPEFQKWNSKFHKMFGQMPITDYSTRLQRR